MRVTVTECRGVDLKPGELFTTADQFYWDHRDPNAVGEKVYIRTDAPASNAPDWDETIYRIAINSEEAQQ